MKWWGCFVKKVENGGGCKKVDLSSTQGALCTVSVFLVYILLIGGGGAYAPNAPPPLPTGLLLLVTSPEWKHAVNDRNKTSSKIIVKELKCKHSVSCTLTTIREKLHDRVKISRQRRYSSFNRHHTFIPPASATANAAAATQSPVLR